MVNRPTSFDSYGPMSDITSIVITFSFLLASSVNFALMFYVSRYKIEKGPFNPNDHLWPFNESEYENTGRLIFFIGKVLFFVNLLLFLAFLKFVINLL